MSFYPSSGQLRFFLARFLSSKNFKNDSSVLKIGTVLKPFTKGLALLSSERCTTHTFLVNINALPSS